MRMILSEYVTLFSWGLASSLQVIFLLMALLIFLKSRDSVFGWYAVYCFLMLVYCITKLPDFLYPIQQVREWKSHYLYQSFYWFLQILYHNAYMAFGIRFMDLIRFKPRLGKAVIWYQKINLGVAVVVYLLTSFSFIRPSLMFDFFLIVFAPLHLLVSLFILLIIIRLKKEVGTFIIGTFCYMILILISFSLTYFQISWDAIKPAAIFYFAITVESSIFSLGLGLRIKNIYKERLKFQYNLNAANTKLQAELKKQIDAQHREQELLVELNQKQELEIEVARLNVQILRSQINSHFIFNVLNSIKLYIMENDTKKAAAYLTKFSKFIRKILDGSFDENSTLKDEFEISELYLNIEKERLSNSFSFIIEVADDVDLLAYKFPAMLLQPFIENALWHGLMQAEGEKRLGIYVCKKSAYLSIIIDDNGLGFESVKKGQNSGKKKSYGLEIVKRRIKEFNAKNQSVISYKTSDKSDTEGRGTSVEIRYYNCVI